MSDNLENMFAQIGGGNINAVKSKSGELNLLADSTDGKKVKAMLEGANLSEAAQRGDTEALKNALAGILGTEEGRRFCSKLNELIK
ncbi:MAG: hypothetical protein IKI49_02485 [Oscillospiraceae bacterium]|nr:hypothetical protein [Oscillospiraceae bacterium]